MDCNTARLLLCFDRPGAIDLGTEGKEALEGHLQECARCRRQSQLERQADEVVAVAVRQVPVPADLAGQLKARLATERRSLYRRFLLRRGRDLAIAAALLVALILGARYWAYATRPVIDLEQLERLVNERLDVRPDQLERLASDTLRVKIALPRNFNYDRLYSCSIQEFKGRRVPQMVFRSPTGQIVEVLILTDAQFNLDQSALRPRFGSGNITMELRPDPEDPKIGYLITYSGESCDWLVVGDVPGAAL